MKNINTTELINFFHKAPIANAFSKADFVSVNKKSVLFGYAIHPDCCTIDVLMWLDTLTANYNATFYKEWNDILSKNRFELFVDQILHYATTYGTDFSLGNGYVPNDGSISPEFKNLKVIEPISYEDLFEKCYNIVKSGIALNKNTLKVVCDYILEYDKENRGEHSPIDLDCIKNKEAQVYLSTKMNMFPTDEFAILRCLVYQYTDSTLLIKNRATISRIKSSALNFDMLMNSNHPIMNLTDDNIISLSKIFYRFKPLFLAMKTKKTSSVINRLRKLAKKNHKPFNSGFWETIVSSPKSYSEIENRVGELDNFRKIRIIQAINVALYSNESAKVYNIRNGKVYTRIGYSPEYDREYLLMIRPLFENSLIESLSKKACNVKFSKDFNITLPSTEKSFVGNFPFGSSIKFNTNSVVGIYWRNEWGCHDFDLSFINTNGRRVGWNSSLYKNQDVIYSGDMTNANPEAVETMFIRNRCSDSIVYVNEFNGYEKAKFRLFFANEEMDPRNMRNHMVDPNNIKLDTMIDVDNERQKIVGLIHNNTFYFMNLHSGNGNVSCFDDTGKSFIDTMCNRTKCFLDMKDILIRAGFVEVEDGETPDIDFTHPEKDTIINLLSTED